jgi:hypothetical protein
MPFDLRTGSVMMTIGFLRCLNFCKHLLDRTSHTPNGSLTPSRGCGRSLGHPSYNEIRSEMDPTLLNRLRLSSRRGAHRARPHRRLRAIQDDNLHRGLDGDRRPSVVPSRFNVMVRMDRWRWHRSYLRLHGRRLAGRDLTSPRFTASGRRLPSLKRSITTNLETFKLQQERHLRSRSAKLNRGRCTIHYASGAAMSDECAMQL